MIELSICSRFPAIEYYFTDALLYVQKWERRQVSY